MKKLFAIRPFNGKIRTNLCMDDIDLIHPEVLHEFGLIEIHTTSEQDVSTVDSTYLVFKFGYRVPYFNLFYARKITSHKDKYLTLAITRLLYLNPGKEGSDSNLKAVTQFILSTFSVTKKVESSVKDGKFIDVPVLEYDKVFALVCSINWMKIADTYEPDTEKLVMYSRDSKIPKNQKISINAKHRAETTVSYYESAIHNAAEFLHESQELVKITDSRIKNTNLVKVKNYGASVRTITRYMAPRTRAMIDELNLIKPFKNNKRYEKYQEFKNLERDAADVQAEKLSVSKSTIFEFRKINNLNNNNHD